MGDHGIRLAKEHTFPGMSEIDPQPSPAMAGGLFSIHREYFFHIGAFDEGMYHWGGENIEIGFRAWQCGGSIELIKCSRVGHLWGGMGKTCGWPGGSPGTKNKWRAIEVWMDPVHQDIMREHLPYPSGGTGDLSNLIAIRDNLKCKGFDYFLEKAYPECWMRVVEKAKYQGALQNVATDQCINPWPKPVMRSCQLKRGRSGNQYVYLTPNSEILAPHGADLDSCIEAPFDKHGTLSIFGCHGQKGNQEWVYEGSILKHASFCLEADSEGNLFIETCHGGRSQDWVWNPGPK